MNEKLPRCAVVIATLNGEKYLEQQLDSIVNQEGIDVKIYFSDDGSEDSTKLILHKYGAIDVNPSCRNFGSACQNFLNAFVTVCTSYEFDYLFFSDQDDIWKPTKMFEAIKSISSNNVDAYSGSYEIIFNNSKKYRYVDRSFEQNEVSHLFRGPGPGFTFAFTSVCAQHLANEINKMSSLLQKLRWHDWFLFALAKSLGKRWFIDSRSFAFYRIHDANDTGQPLNVRALYYRFMFLFSGKFRDQIIITATLVNQHEKVSNVSKFGLIERVLLLKEIKNIRSSWIARLALVAWVLFSKAPK